MLTYKGKLYYHEKRSRLTLQITICSEENEITHLSFSITYMDRIEMIVALTNEEIPDMEFIDREKSILDLIQLRIELQNTLDLVIILPITKVLLFEWLTSKPLEVDIN